MGFTLKEVHVACSGCQGEETHFSYPSNRVMMVIVRRCSTNTTTQKFKRSLTTRVGSTVEPGFRISTCSLDTRSTKAVKMQWMVYWYYILMHDETILSVSRFCGYPEVTCHEYFCLPFSIPSLISWLFSSPSHILLCFSFNSLFLTPAWPWLKTSSR